MRRRNSPPCFDCDGDYCTMNCEPVRVDYTPIGPQHVLPGAERAPDRVVAERRWSAPSRSSKPQREAGPLFAADTQIDLIDYLGRK